MIRLRNLLVDAVARVPARVQIKLLTAFLMIVALLIILGAVSWQVISGMNDRTEELIDLQQKIAAYRQVQLDTTSQLYSITSTFISPDEQGLESVLRQLTQFGYDLDRLQHIAQGEVELLARVRQEYDRFIDIVTKVVELTRSGRLAKAREMQLNEARPLAARLERLTNQMVNVAEADMISGIEASQRAYKVSRMVVICFAVGSIILALALGYVISWSLVAPVTQIESRLSAIAAGDFSQRVEVVNRDELGALANNVNRTSEQLGRLYQEVEARSDELKQSLLRIQALHDQVQGQAKELAEWNQKLESRIAEQVIEIERIGRLKRFLAPQIAELIISSGDDSVLESHRRDVAVVFCDLRNFTSFAETAQPEEIMRLLGDYHTCLGQLIHRFEGTLERFTGDGLIILFNDPLPCADPCERAVKLAVAMRTQADLLSAKWRKYGHELGFGIGIAFGYATLGRIGYEGRFDYTAIGSVVNLAARLCAEAKDGQILVDSKVHTAIEAIAQTELLGELACKGFHRPVKAFNVRALH